MIKRILFAIGLFFCLGFTLAHAKELTLGQLILEMRNLVPDKDIHYLSNISGRNIPIWKVKDDRVTNGHLSSSAQCVSLFSCKPGEYCLLDYRGTLGIIRYQDVKREAKGKSLFWSDRSCKAQAKKRQQKANSAYAAVTKVASNDQLNIRRLATHKSEKVGSIPYNGHCVRKHSCQGKWCKVTYKGVTGWVNQTYLKKETWRCT